MKIKNSRIILLVGLVALLAGGFALTTQHGKAQLIDPLPHLEPINFVDATDSWHVQVKNACLVDAVKVGGGSVPSVSEENFQTDTFTDDSREAGNTAQGKSACAKAKDTARGALPGKLWAEGDKLCQEWEKAPPNKAGKKCIAVRGNLQADAITCSCDFERQDAGRNSTRKWKAKATCIAPDVKYVCDP